MSLRLAGVGAAMAVTRQIAELQKLKRSLSPAERKLDSRRAGV